MRQDLAQEVFVPQRSQSGPKVDGDKQWSPPPRSPHTALRAKRCSEATGDSEEARPVGTQTIPDRLSGSRAPRVLGCVTGHSVRSPGQLGRPCTQVSPAPAGWGSPGGWGRGGDHLPFTLCSF